MRLHVFLSCSKRMIQTWLFSWIITSSLVAQSFSVDTLVIGAAGCMDEVSVCLPGITPGGWDSLALQLDGQAVDPGTSACAVDTLIIYSYDLLFGQGQAGPYQLDSWLVDGTTFSGTFQNIPDLVDSMNLWDPAGNWTHMPSTLSIQGGDPARMYGPMSVTVISIGSPSQLGVNYALSATGTVLSIKPGVHLAVLTDQSAQPLDSLFILATCLNPTTWEITLAVGESEDYCLPLDELLGSEYEHEILCGSDPSILALDLDQNSGCMTLLAISPGEQTLCFLSCDDFGFCDTTTVIVEVLGGSLNSPLAQKDVVQTYLDLPVVISVLSNDSFAPGSLEVLVSTPPLRGSAVVNADATITYQPQMGQCGIDSLRYTLCQSGNCDDAWVEIEVFCTPEPPIEVFTGFSPNGDGINDFFTIGGLEDFPQNNLEVYNRWGNLVYRKENYQGSWDGTWEGQNLPDGGYVYRLVIPSLGTYSGMLHIQR